MITMKSISALKKLFALALFISTALLIYIWNGVTLLSFDEVKVHPKNKICGVNLNDTRKTIINNTALKMIYFVTPTYPRPEQTPELMRLSHTLMHVPGIHWIVADDQPLCSKQVSSILRRSGLPYTHISSPKLYNFKAKNNPRGVANRLAALSWLHKHVQNGVLYFGDDDNTIDLQLFDEIRSTKKVSMFPVGLIGEYGVSAPVVKKGKVVGFFDSWPGSRTFPVDMGGFAINIEYLKPTASMPYRVGQEEDKFLVSLGLKMEEIEPLANNCSKVLVWHTKTKKHKKSTLKINIDKLSQHRSFADLLREVSQMEMAHINAITGTKAFIITGNLKNIPVEHIADLM